MSGRPAGPAPSRREQSAMRSRLALAGAVLTLGLSVAACGSSTTTTVTTAAQTTASSSTTTPAASSATTSSSASTTTTTAPSTAAGPPLCTAPMLTGTLLGQQGAAGHGALGFALRNTSGHACHTFGYPGVQFLSATGAPLPTVSTRTTRDLLGAAPRVALTLGPGAQASFRLVVTHGIASSNGCTTAHALGVIPPDDTETLRIAIADGAYECGTTTVTPLQPGTSAYP